MLPDDLDDRVRALAAGCTEPSRLRIDAVPAATGLEVVVTARPADPSPQLVQLVAAEVPGGWGAHKWIDRAPLVALRERHGLREGQDLLLVDEAGLVLETERASLFARFGQLTLTPPLDGRILPGTGRARELAAQATTGQPVLEAAFSLDHLRRADAIVLTNALRREPAVLLR
jgi:para-aminobenzoate synthetase/4-amino-4-deoxychorismate lyase